MNRCVAIHSNGTNEVLDVQPGTHQELRGLGYRRFVVRTADGRSLSSAVYCRLTPSTWQIQDAARKLWGRSTGAVHVFDEHGDLVPSAAGSSTSASSLEKTVDRETHVEGHGAPSTRDAGSAHETALRVASQVDATQLPELIARANRLLPDADPRKITSDMVEDLRRAARELRLSLGERLYNRDDESRFADALDAHARALESYVVTPS
jgi:hypothetical protein